MKSPGEFEKISDLLLNNKKLVKQMGEINRNYVASGRGASQQIIEIIKKYSIK